MTGDRSTRRNSNTRSRILRSMASDPHEFPRIKHDFSATYSLSFHFTSQVIFRAPIFQLAILGTPESAAQGVLSLLGPPIVESASFHVRPLMSYYVNNEHAYPQDSCYHHRNKHSGHAKVTMYIMYLSTAANLLTGLMIWWSSSVLSHSQGENGCLADICWLRPQDSEDLHD
nr:hypothetical protein CFP56_19654 [Quercus suber]